MRETIIGAGRVGTAMAEMGPAHLVRRGESIPGGSGPIYVCTRNNDLDGVLSATPAARRADLVFVQNGMISSWLAAHGLQENTQALLYFAVSSVGAAPVDGGRTVAWGPHAPALAARLAAGGLACTVLDDYADFQAEMVEKFLWICVFGLLCQAHGATVGELVSDHRSAVDALTAELGGICEEVLGARLPADLSERLCDYSRSIAAYRGAVKEWRWRNGWLWQQAQTPLHAQALAAAGVDPESA